MIFWSRSRCWGGLSFKSNEEATQEYSVKHKEVPKFLEKFRGRQIWWWLISLFFNFFSWNQFHENSSANLSSFKICLKHREPNSTDARPFRAGLREIKIIPNEFQKSLTSFNFFRYIYYISKKKFYKKKNVKSIISMWPISDYQFQQFSMTICSRFLW